jgi:oxygen-independent coproporphyrinogen III oxidase
METVSAYIHIPFCTHRCGYCDFNTYAGLEALIPSYAQAVCKEILILSTGDNQPLPIGTIYFGGGTPSLLPPADLEIILSSLYNHFRVTESIEISLEANPGTVSKTYLKQINSMGVNRISLGMQSSNDDELALLGRQHSHIDVLNAVDWSRAAGINNLNLDLIYGLPNQGLKSWMDTLEAALCLHPQHLSLYALTIEEKTPIYNKVKSGIFPEPDQDLVADMYEYASKRLIDAGYIQYEISNWYLGDQKGKVFSCRHNLQYWHNLPYIGLGAGAHGYIDQQRTVNVSSPRVYIDRLINGMENSTERIKFPWTPATHQIEPIDVHTEIGETMMMGLRLVIEGISNHEFQRRFGMSLQQCFGVQINRLLGFELLEWAGEGNETLRLTNKGRLLGNQVFMEFI